MTKSGPCDLAFLGGSPAFQSAVHVGRPNIGDFDTLVRRLREVVDSRWLTNDGPFVREFEERVKAITGTQHCVATCNATLALQLLLRALGVKGEVILPSFTFAATAHAVSLENLTPVFCDVDPSHCISPIELEKLLTDTTGAVIGVHLWGRTCDIERLQAVCRSRNLPLIFDAAHAFCSSHKQVMVGNFGDAEVFSFHATKAINAGEGGAVVTNDPELARRLRLLRNFGFEGYDNVVEVGTNAKMSELSAIMGLTNLESMSAVFQCNRRNYEGYRANLAGIPGIRLVQFESSETNSYHYIVIDVDPDQSGLDRDTLMAVLHAENVLARRYFFPGCHRMAPYSILHSRDLPITDALAMRLLALPNGTTVTSSDVEAICNIIRLALQCSTSVAGRRI